MCSSGYFAVTNVFRKPAGAVPPGVQFEGLLCHRLDAIPGLRLDSHGSRPRACKGEVPLYLEQDSEVSAALNMPWCNTTEAASTSDPCACLGLVRPQPGFWAPHSMYAERLKVLLRGEDEDFRIILPSFQKFVSDMHLTQEYVTRDMYAKALLLEARSQGSSTSS